VKQSPWVAAAQLGLVLDEEQVSHEGDPFLRQVKHGIIFHVASSVG
jgi:hypothetical protein